MRDFSSRPRARGLAAREWAWLAGGALVLLGSAAVAWDAWRDGRDVRARVVTVRAERDAGAARLRSLEAQVRRDSMRNQAWLTVEAPPPRVVADLAELLPPEVRLEELSLKYGRRLEVDMRVSARRAAAYDLFLERLGTSPRFSEVSPGDENRAGEVRAHVHAAYREEDPPVRSRLAAAALLLVAAVVYTTVARPLRQQQGLAADEYRRLREERRIQQSRLAALERRESRHQSLAVAADAWARRDVLREARLTVLRTLDQASLKEVRLGVSRTNDPTALASVRLTAQGDFGDVVRTSGELVRPGSGFVLESVRLSPREEGVNLSLEAVVPGAHP